jgi:hypothetical protein
MAGAAMKLTQAFLTLFEEVYRETGVQPDIAIKEVALDELAFDRLVKEHAKTALAPVRRVEWDSPGAPATLADVEVTWAPTIMLNGVRFTRRPR